MRGQDLHYSAHVCCPPCPRHVRFLCFLMGHRGFFWSVPLLFPGWMFCNSLLLWGPSSLFYVILLLLLLLFFLILAFWMSQTISSEAADAVFRPCKLWPPWPRSLTLNRSGVSARCSDCLLVDFTPCLCPPFNLSLSVFVEMCLASSSLVYSIRPPPTPPLASLPSLSLAFLRTRLIAGPELYIQVNSWDGWPAA